MTTPIEEMLVTKVLKNVNIFEELENSVNIKSIGGYSVAFGLSSESLSLSLSAKHLQEMCEDKADIYVCLSKFESPIITKKNNCDFTLSFFLEHNKLNVAKNFLVEVARLERKIYHHIYGNLD